MQAEPVPAPETKAAETTGDVAGAFEDFMRTFEAFKAENDGRLAEIEQKRVADVLTVEKVDRINRALDEQKRLMDALVLKTRRPLLGRDGQPLSAETIEHKAAFEAYVRGGAEDALRGIERKALSVASDGGYLVPDETEREIGRRLSAASPIRAIAGLRQVSGSTYRKPFVTAGAATGWVGETDSRPQTTAPTLAELEFPTMELYAMPAATATLLDDCGRQHRRLAGGRGRDRLRRAGGHRLRHRRRRQEADRLPLLHDRRRGDAGPGRRSATSRPASTAPGRRRPPPTSWSTSSTR